MKNMLIGGVYSVIIYQTICWHKTDECYTERRHLKDQIKSHDDFKNDMLRELDPKGIVDKALNNYFGKGGFYETNPNIWCNGMSVTKSEALEILELINKDVIFWENISPITLKSFRKAIYRREDIPKYLAGE